MPDGQDAQRGLHARVVGQSQDDGRRHGGVDAHLHLVVGHEVAQAHQRLIGGGVEHEAGLVPEGRRGGLQLRVGPVVGAEDHRARVATAGAVGEGDRVLDLGPHRAQMPRPGRNSLVIDVARGSVRTSLLSNIHCP